MANYQSTHGKSTLNYNSETGQFTWVLAYRKPSFTGKNACHKATNGYLTLKLNGKMVSPSRLAWQLVNGPIPDGLEIDHINRVRDDNRISNLRAVTRSLNRINTVHRGNRLGVLGVSMHKNGLYRARFRQKPLYFKTLEAASRAYQEMKEGYARLGRDSDPL